MPVIHLKGKILPYEPAAFAVSIKDLPAVDWTDPQTGLVMQITTRIDNSILDVEFNVNAFDENDGNHLQAMLMRGWDLARAAVDLFCFKVGWGLGVVIDTLVKPDGSTSTILPKNEALSAYSTALDPSQTGLNNYDVCYRLIVTEPALFMALNDLIVAITLPHHASINCARVIEGLRCLIAPGLTPKQAWTVMHANLNAEPTYLSFITDTSKGPRHGDRTWIPGTIVNETVKRTWIIMNRFLEFRKRGNTRLPLADFPLLTN